MNQSELIQNSIRHFLNKNKVKIIIGTPCFGGLLHNGFFQSMLDLSVNFTKLNIPFEMMTIGNESLIQRARNGIVARFMGDSDATHLMFIDADITFSWISIVKLLLSGKELSGGCYPKKCFNWDKIKHHIDKNPNLKDDELMAKSLDYVFNPIYHKEGDNVVIKLDNGMAQVKDIGTGFMLIRKSAIYKMIAKFPDTKYRNNVAGYSQGNNSPDDYFYCLFDCGIDPISRVYLSEDYLFCKRWIDIGGELWLDLNTNLNHTGLIDYKGCLSITIGEVDTLNKDAQIMRQQSEKDKEKSNTTNTTNTNTTNTTNKKTIEEKKAEITKAVAEAKALQDKDKKDKKDIIAEILSETSLQTKKKKKNKNKKNNKNKKSETLDILNTSNTSVISDSINKDDDSTEEEDNDEVESNTSVNSEQPTTFIYTNYCC